ncbi:MAG: transporter [Alphaproteobacteria bacterium]|nr:transporter [Alphaproteobacteria bacterium]
MPLRFPLALLLALAASPAWAGPPYITDDPEPTDFRHFEIYLFEQGTAAREGTGGAFGIDFNYGAAPDLQLTAVLPVEYETAPQGPDLMGIGNVELAAKYRVLHQDDVGWDVAVFPRLFLPSGSALVGDKHVSLLLPVWVGRDFDTWSTFGGGGCTLHRGGDAQDFCLAGWALTREIAPSLRLGAEIVHQGADTKGGKASTGIGAGVTYDLNEHTHLLAYAGPGLQNAAETGQTSWYTSILFTF